jgi:hypothetical protein
VEVKSKENVREVVDVGAPRSVSLGLVLVDTKLPNSFHVSILNQYIT